MDCALPDRRDQMKSPELQLMVHMVEAIQAQSQHMPANQQNMRRAFDDALGDRLHHATLTRCSTLAQWSKDPYF